MTDPPAAGGSPYWPGWSEVRGDLRGSLRVALAVALTGVPAGLLWWLLAPRAEFEITGDGPEPLGSPSNELLVADDAVLALVLLGVGLIGGLTTWFLHHRRRGVADVLALAVGASAAAVLAWQVGELLGPNPSEAQLTDVGARVTTALRLGSAAVLAVGPFAALFGYLAAVLFARDDGLGRTAGTGRLEDDGSVLHPATAGPPPGPAPAPAEPRGLADAPPPGRPSA